MQILPRGLFRLLSYGNIVFFFFQFFFRHFFFSLLYSVRFISVLIFFSTKNTVFFFFQYFIQHFFFSTLLRTFLYSFNFFYSPKIAGVDYNNYGRRTMSFSSFYKTRLDKKKETKKPFRFRSDRRVTGLIRSTVAINYRHICIVTKRSPVRVTINVRRESEISYFYSWFFFFFL